MTEHRAGAAAERAARVSYGRLVALLAASTRDIALAEDALADAFERAVRTWPTTGVPHNPQGWLVTVARNRIRDLLASAAVRTAAPLDDHVVATITELDLDAIPDKRLELLFACAHPAIDPAVRTPLMLQVVLGFDSARISRVFAVQPAAMAQRLVRAKRRAPENDICANAGRSARKAAMPSTGPKAALTADSTAATALTWRPLAPTSLIAAKRSSRRAAARRVAVFTRISKGNSTMMAPTGAIACSSVEPS